MKAMVASSEYNASVVEFNGITLPPPLLPASTYDVYYFVCASIEHIRLYMSVLSFLINFSNTVPCNFVQIYVLYQGTFVNQYVSRS